jgi:predicted dienelactone hydrolase
MRRHARLVGVLVAVLSVVAALFAGLPAARAGSDVGIQETARDHFGATGSWAVTTETVTVPGTPAATLVRPRDLGSGGYRHPIVTWANGAGGACSNFTDTLQHLASWGYFVVCPNTGEIVPDHVLAAARWAVQQGGASGSPYQGKLNTGKVAAAGHSRGSGTSLAAGGRDTALFDAIVASSFTDRWTHGDPEGVEALSKLSGTSIFFVAGTADFLVTEGEQQFFFGEAAGPAARAAVIGAGHGYVQQADNAMQPYITAWLKYALENDSVARQAFVGASPPELTEDPEYDWQELRGLG